MIQRNLLAVALVILTGASAALAQTAGMMSFQGYIKDAAGVPVNGTVNLLFDVRSSTTSLVTFNVNGVAAKAGVVTSKYGPIAPSHFDGTQRFLRVTVTPVSPPGSPFTLENVEIVTPPGIAEQLNAPGTGTAAIRIGPTGNVGMGSAPTSGDGLYVLGQTTINAQSSSALRLFGNSLGQTLRLHTSDWNAGIEGTDIRFEFEGLGNTRPFIQAARAGGAQPASLMINPSGGNVGIGVTSTALEALQVGEGAAGATIQVGSYTAFGEVYSSGATLLGDNVKPANSVNGMVFMTPQAQYGGGRAIEMHQDKGIAFHTTAVGAAAEQPFSGNERMRITNDGNVCIGTTSPGSKLTIRRDDDGKLLSFERLGRETWWMGPIGTGDAGLAVANQSDGDAVRLFFAESGNVGVGTTNPGHTLCVNGSIGAIGGLQSCSDARFKTNIASLDSALDTLDKLRAVRFDWRCDEFPDRNFDDKPQIGFIAQELLDVVPEVVQQGSDGFYSVDYGRLTPVLTAAMQEMHALVQKLETAGREKDAEIAALRATAARQQAAIDELAKRLERMEAAIVANDANGGGK